MKAPFAYFGGKSGMAHDIAALMPPHRVYIEPFFGSGAVFFAKGPVAHEIINDIDDRVVTFFRVLRERPEDLAQVCTLTPYSRTEYEMARASAEDLDDLEVARRFWVSVNQSFAKTSNATTGWSVTVARTQSPPNTVKNRIGRFMACAERLSSVSIEHSDAADLVDRLAKSTDTVVYCDPPYLHSTRVGRQHRARDYTHEAATEDDHRRLAKSLHNTAATVILSGYPSPLYDELFGEWWSVDRSVTAFSSNARTTERTGRVERIWMNRDPERHLFNQPRYQSERGGEFSECETGETGDKG